MRYLAQSKPVKFRLKVGETECRSIEDVKHTSDFPSLWKNYEDGNLKKWLSQINQNDYLDEVDKHKDDFHKRLTLFYKFTNGKQKFENDYIQMFNMGIIPPDIFNEKCAKDQKLLNQYFEITHSVEQLNETNTKSIFRLMIEQKNVTLDNQLLNKICSQDVNVLKEYYDKFSNENLDDANLNRLIELDYLTKIKIIVKSESFNMINVNGKFLISEFPVTNALWESLMLPKRSVKSSDSDYCPVSLVDWYDCNNFINSLNYNTRKRFRLPTDVEWKLAAQGGNEKTNYPYSGSDDINKVAWYDGNSDRKSHPVGGKAPNELGLYDMSGNVWELCDDKSKPDFKWLLGGCYNSSFCNCKLQEKVFTSKEAASVEYGFRLAMDCPL